MGKTTDQVDYKYIWWACNRNKESRLIMKFVDNAEKPIIAFDFDGVIAVNSEGEGSTYPIPQDYRVHTPEVTNFMHELGIIIAVWTCREKNGDVDHITPAKEWMNDKNIYYDTVNDTFDYAPYHYNPRKIYAHMYVDDKAYGWHGSDNGNDPMMLLVLEQFLIKVCGFSQSSAGYTVRCCENGDHPEKWMVEAVKNFKTRRYRVRLEEELF